MEPWLKTSKFNPNQGAIKMSRKQSALESLVNYAAHAFARVDMAKKISAILIESINMNIESVWVNGVETPIKDLKVFKFINEFFSDEIKILEINGNKDKLVELITYLENNIEVREPKHPHASKLH
jgi:mRNA-degrading endonuclease HigB of HigAB toxin-antitoxin module